MKLLLLPIPSLYYYSSRSVIVLIGIITIFVCHCYQFNDAFTPQNSLYRYRCDATTYSKSQQLRVTRIYDDVVQLKVVPNNATNAANDIITIERKRRPVVAEEARRRKINNNNSNNNVVLTAPNGDERSVTLLSSDDDNGNTMKMIAKKPKVLFFHNKHSNGNVASHLLELDGYTEFFDFVIPDGLYDATKAPDDVPNTFGLNTMLLETKGLYPDTDTYYEWGTRPELLSTATTAIESTTPMESTASSLCCPTKKQYWNDLAAYMIRIDELYGPFDGVMGFGEGGAALNSLLTMKQTGYFDNNYRSNNNNNNNQEDNKNDDGNAITTTTTLDSINFFVHIASFKTPMNYAITATTNNNSDGEIYNNNNNKLTIPTLAAYSLNDENQLPGYPEAYAKYHENFEGYYEEHVHFDGIHNYPRLTRMLRSKIVFLLREANNGYVSKDAIYEIDRLPL